MVLLIMMEFIRHFDVPSTDYTNPLGINDFGDIVGVYLANETAVLETAA